MRMGSNQGSSRANALDKRVPRNPRYAGVKSKVTNKSYPQATQTGPREQRARKTRSVLEEKKRNRSSETPSVLVPCAAASNRLHPPILHVQQIPQQ